MEHFGSKAFDVYKLNWANNFVTIILTQGRETKFLHNLH